MILKRLSEGIRNQDWFVVMVEIMIVVVGIFIGLQVDDWNKARKDRILELRYLQRIDAELVKDIAAITGSTLSETRAGYGQLLLNAIEDSSVVADDPLSFLRAVAMAGYTFEPTLFRLTFEEMKSSGDFAIIQKEGLRDAISGYYALVTKYKQWNYIREYMQINYTNAGLGILSSEHTVSINNLAEVTLEEAMATYKRLLLKPEFIARIPFAIYWQKTSQGINHSFLVAAEALRVEIADELISRRGSVE